MVTLGPVEPVYSGHLGTVEPVYSGHLGTVEPVYSGHLGTSLLWPPYTGTGGCFKQVISFVLD